MPSVALLSDIHGNLPALQAVLAELASRRPDAVYVLGDMTNGCPWTAEVMDLLIDAGWPMLLGNHDDAVLQLDTPRMEPRYANRERYETLWWTREHLSGRHLTCLQELPLELNPHLAGAPPPRLFHGVPGNFFIGFRPDGTEEWAAGHLANVAEETVADGHTHFPMVRRLGRWQVVNDGPLWARVMMGTRVPAIPGWRATRPAGRPRSAAWPTIWPKSTEDLSNQDCWPPGE